MNVSPLLKKEKRVAYVKFINLTEHPIILPGNVLIEPERDASGRLHLARCTRYYAKLATVNGVELSREILTNVQGLPLPQSGVIYIVSNWVRRALPDRKDLASPGKKLRDDNGNIIGAINLIIN